MDNINTFRMRIPFYVTIAGLFSPLISTISGYIFIEKIMAELILIIIYSVIFIKDHRVLKVTYKQLFLYGLLLFLFIYSLSRPIVFGGFGVYSIFLMTLMYTNIFYRYGSVLSFKEFCKQISFIFFINIAFIFFENIFNFLGLGELLVEVTNNRYRLDLFSTLNYFNVDNFTSANSLLLKAQGASVILAAAIIWFLDPFKLNTKRNYFIWLFLISVILYSIQFTTTSMLSILFMTIFGIYFMPETKFRFGLSKGALSLVLFIFSPVLLKIIFFKIDGLYIDDAYLLVVSDAFETLYSLNLDAVLFGIGGFHEENKLTTDVYEVKSGDFGLLMIFIMGGALLFLLITISLVSYFYRVISVINREWKGASREMVGLGATLAILVFGLTVSVVHYTNIVQPGGRHLYAFLISISIYCIYSVKGKRKYPIKNNTCPSSDSAGVLV